jgi:hypothetical protein
MAEKEYIFGLNKDKKKPPTYVFGLRDNKCDIPGADDTDDCKPANPVSPPSDNTSHSTCYEKIQSIDNYANEYEDVNKCIDNINKAYRCNQRGNYLRCASDFEQSQLKDSCLDQDDALRTIVDYCNNTRHQPPKACNKVYDTSKMKSMDDKTKLDQMIHVNDYNCPEDCNLDKVNAPDVNKYTYSGTLKSDSTNMNCHEMSKYILNCKNIIDKHKDEFNNYYHDFIKNGKFEWDRVMVSKDSNNKFTPLSGEKLDGLLKYSMCKIAADNIDIVKGAKIDQSLTNWWNYNIFNKQNYTDNENKIHKTGFQRNIFYISFFIVLFLKLTILSKFNIMPGTKTYINKVLPTLTILFSIIIFYGFINNLEWISTIARVSFYLFISAIIFGIGFYIKDKIWSKNESNRQVLAILLFVGCILLLVKSVWGISDNSTFISVSILLYFIFISIFFILKSEKTTLVFKMISILMISLLLLIYLFYTKDLLFNVIYFYVFIFIILIFIICTNNTDLFSKRFNDETSSKYVKIINVILRPFKSDNKMTSTDKISKFIILGLYVIFAFADSFISVLSPQMALVIMIAFRLVLNRWFEPVNAIFASLSGYSMSNVEGTYDRLTTTNKGVLDVDNLLSFFIK